MPNLTFKIKLDLDETRELEKKRECRRKSSQAAHHQDTNPLPNLLLDVQNAATSTNDLLTSCSEDIKFTFEEHFNILELLYNRFQEYADSITAFLKDNPDGCEIDALHDFHKILLEEALDPSVFPRNDAKTDQRDQYCNLLLHNINIYWQEVQRENERKLAEYLVRLREAMAQSNFLDLPDQERETEPQFIRRYGSVTISYNERRRIGKGGSSVVYEGLFGQGNSEPRPVAIKKINTKKVNMVDNELEIWRSLEDIPTSATVNVVRLLDSILLTKGFKEYRYFTMELADIDLAKEIQIRKENTCLRNRQALVNYLQDAARGLQWLHSQRPAIIHRDVTPNNILIFRDPLSGVEVAKISDFGISRRVKEVHGTRTVLLPEGGYLYSPPEVLRWETPHKNEESQIHESVKGDIFSFGITAYYTMSYGEHPFYLQGPNCRISTNILEEAPDILQAPEYAANYLFHWMMQKIPEDRPTIEQVLSHPFFWDRQKCFHFLLEMGRAFDIKTDDMAELKEKIIKDYLDIQTEADFDWKSRIDKVVIDECIGMHKKKYNQSASIMTLIEFIRDKTMHYAEMSKVLLTPEYFAEDGAFNDAKFTNYILERFDNLVAFLHVELGNNDFDGLRKLKNDFGIKNQKAFGLELAKATATKS